MRDSLIPYSPAAPTRPVDVAGQRRIAEDPAADLISSSTQPLSAELSALLRRLRPGQRIRVTQTVRVGLRNWPAVAEGVYRDLKYLVTGLATDRVQEDDIVVVSVHFAKDNGELSCVTLDDHSLIELVG
jgi:hypothetical protein